MALRFDRVWPSLPLLLLGLAVAVAGVGVAAAPAATETERIADTVERFGRAVQERRGEDACALLTPAARQAVAARTGTLDCATTVRSFGVGLDGSALRAARVVRAEVTGNRAAVSREQLLAPGGAPIGRALRLERIAGAWRIAAFG